MDALGNMKVEPWDEKANSDDSVYLYSNEYNDDVDDDDDEDCAFSYQKEDDLDDSLKKNEYTEDNNEGQQKCKSSETIVQKSQIHPRALVADGHCNFDNTTYGYWYVAECVSTPTTDDNSSDGMVDCCNSS